MDFQLYLDAASENPVEIEAGNPVRVTGTITDSAGNTPDSIDSIDWEVTNESGTSQGSGSVGTPTASFSFLIPASANALAGAADELRYVNVEIQYDSSTDGNDIPSEITRFYLVRYPYRSST